MIIYRLCAMSVIRKKVIDYIKYLNYAKYLD